MTDEQTKQAILGFTEFFKSITGNQNLEIPSEIAEKYGIQPKTGHWIRGKYKDTCNKCRCTYPINIGFKKFCPNCGCRMIKPQESEVNNEKEV